MRYSVTIHTEEDLLQFWTDSRCPNLGWGFLEETLEDCLQDDGTCIATYETLEIPEGETMCFTYLNGSGETTYHLQAGEYGVKPE
jgi:hypothetical protein